MNKQATVLIAVVVALALVGAGIWVIAVSGNPVSDTQQTDQPTTTDTPTTSENNTGTTASPSASAESITIADFAFAPSTLTVKRGTKVTWVNKDSVVHTVEPESGSPAGAPKSSGNLNTNSEYSFTFDTVGTFNYYCGPHPSMKGKVVVVE